MNPNHVLRGNPRFRFEALLSPALSSLRGRSGGNLFGPDTQDVARCQRTATNSLCPGLFSRRPVGTSKCVWRGDFKVGSSRREVVIIAQRFNVGRS